MTRARHDCGVPKDPRGPEYGEPSRVERLVTALLVIVIGLAVVAALLAAVTDLGGLVAGIGPPWLTVSVAIAIVVLLLVLVFAG